MRKNILLYSILMILLLLATNSVAQQGNNPFELPDRLIAIDSITVSASGHLGADTIIPSSTTNPFELVRTAVSTAASESIPDTTVNSQEEATTLPVNPFEKRAATSSVNPKVPKTTSSASEVNPGEVASGDLSNRFKLFLVIGLLTLLTILVALYNSIVTKVYRSFLNDNFLKMVHRDQDTIVAIPYLILYIFALISLGAFIFMLLNYFKAPLSGTHLSQLAWCILASVGLFGLKHLALYILASVFPIKKEIRQYNFTIIIFGIILGLLLVPATVLVSYVPEGLKLIFIYGTFVAIALLYGYRVLRSLFIAGRYITLHKFHFFVYLCTIEIAPIFVLLKIAGWPF